MEAQMFTTSEQHPVHEGFAATFDQNDIDRLRRNPNILIADPDRDVLDQLLRSFSLCAKHCNVFTAQDGQQAVSLMLAYPMDILLADLHMRVAEEFRVIDYARINHPAMRTFAMTDGGTFPLHAEMQDLGVHGLISKPCRIEMLYSVLRV
jgi:two-component system response regulator YesN